MISNIEIEEIESQILEDIHSALGNKNELVDKLENSNDTISQWINSINDKNKFFDVGAERIVYDSLYNNKHLGRASSWPIGSDLSFQHTLASHKQKVLINIDCKTVSTYNYGDIQDSMFVGSNQNSFKSTYINSGQERKYEPLLSPSYNIGGEDILTLSYFICILYDPIPKPLEPKEIKTRLIFTCCMPNGILSSDYSKINILSGGKSAQITAGQILTLPNGDKYTTEKDDCFRSFKYPEKCIYTKTGFKRMEIQKLNKVEHDPIKSTVRFEFLNCSKFINLTNENRIKVKYLEKKDTKFLKSKILKFNTTSGNYDPTNAEWSDELNKFRAFL